MIWLNGVKLNFTKFPNGETKMNEFEIRQNLYYYGSKHINNVKFQYETDADLIELMFVKKYIDIQSSNADLIITYMPYSRMDRSEDDSAFTLKYVAEFINGLNFRKVTVIEPHSDVTPALLNNCESNFVSMDELFYEVINRVNFNSNNDYIYFTDASSFKRYSNKIGKGYNELIGMKNRDFVTGNISNLSVVGNIEHDKFKVIMLDDVIATGTTCLLGARQLRELGASHIYIIVTHCENSIYTGELLYSDLIDKIYTTDSILTNFSSDKIVVYKV